MHYSREAKLQVRNGSIVSENHVEARILIMKPTPQESEYIIVMRLDCSSNGGLSSMKVIPPVSLARALRWMRYGISHSRIPGWKCVKRSAYSSDVNSIDVLQDVLGRAISVRLNINQPVSEGLNLPYGRIVISIICVS
ncbi:hypothetical protein NPIL_337511 [Nephila pilipes]|uniref:Uncharacterized protein n=1 Tax=Nephila pilipes TaxID=299642 RepID=A0A8X6U8B9_NEPPI|nr:hypothetical protein NPIL_337511 [Nephila pilipes]